MSLCIIPFNTYVSNYYALDYHSQKSHQEDGPPDCKTPRYFLKSLLVWFCNRAGITAVAWTLGSCLAAIPACLSLKRKLETCSSSRSGQGGLGAGSGRRDGWGAWPQPCSSPDRARGGSSAQQPRPSGDCPAPFLPDDPGWRASPRLRGWLELAMPLSLRSSVFLDLVVGVVGTLSFLLDVVADLWAVVQYVLGGRYVWAALVLALLGLSSVQMQLFSWVWLTSDPADLHESKHSRRFLALLHLLQLGYLYR